MAIPPWPISASKPILSYLTDDLKIPSSESLFQMMLLEAIKKIHIPTCPLCEFIISAQLVNLDSQSYRSTGLSNVLSLNSTQLDSTGPYCSTVQLVPSEGPPLELNSTGPFCSTGPLRGIPSGPQLKSTGPTWNQCKLFCLHMMEVRSRWIVCVCEE